MYFIEIYRKLFLITEIGKTNKLQGLEIQFVSVAWGYVETANNLSAHFTFRLSIHTFCYLLVA